MTKISELTDGGNVQDGDTIPVVRGGATQGADIVGQPASLSTLKGLTTSRFSADDVVYLRGRTSVGDGGEGHFRWDSSDLSTEVGNDEVTAGEGDGGIYVAPDSDKTGASGAWVRQFSGSVNVRWYGAPKDGTTDATTECQRAIDNGSSVFFPKGTYLVSTSLTPSATEQTIWGEGNQSVIKCTTADVIPLQVSQAGCRVQSLAFTGDDNKRTWRLELSADRCVVTNCLFFSHRQGVRVVDCDDCIVAFNTFTGNVAPSGANDTEWGDEIRVNAVSDAKSQRHIIYGNNIDSGGTFGISLFTLADGDPTPTAEINECIIANNVCRDLGGYGIQVYRNGSTSSLNRNVITGNIISSIVGSAVNGSGQQVYGCGIYLQSSNDTIVSDNYIYDVAQNTQSDSLLPHGIGVNQSPGSVITGNWIEKVGQGTASANTHGIGCSDVSGRMASGDTLSISNNRIRTTKNDGISVEDYFNITVSGNSLSDLGNDAIRLKATNLSEITNITINGNVVEDVAADGFSIDKAKGLSITGNSIKDLVVYGIEITNCDRYTISGNNIEGGTNSAASSIRLTDNNTDDGVVCANGCHNHAGYGIDIDVACLVKNNVTEGNATKDFRANGSNTGFWPFADGDATPSIKHYDKFETANTGATTITGFDDVPKGHEFWVYIDDSNTAIDFTQAGLNGNGGSSLSASSGDVLRCFERAGVISCIVASGG